MREHDARQQRENPGQDSKSPKTRRGFTYLDKVFSCQKIDRKDADVVINPSVLKAVPVVTLQQFCRLAFWELRLQRMTILLGACKPRGESFATIAQPLSFAGTLHSFSLVFIPIETWNSRI